MLWTSCELDPWGKHSFFSDWCGWPGSICGVFLSKADTCFRLTHGVFRVSGVTYGCRGGRISVAEFVACSASSLSETDTESEPK